MESEMEKDKSVKNREKVRKFIEEKKLRFYDDFIFGKVLENKGICRRFLQALLGREVMKVEQIHLQKTEKEGYNQKGVRFDVYVKGETEGGEEIYDIECQVANTEDLALRARYYHSMIDVTLLKKGEGYGKLKPVYVIFVCLKDPFGRGKAMYPVRMMDTQDKVIVEDRSYSLYYNCEKAEEAESEELRGLLRYIRTNEMGTELTKDINAMVEEVVEEHGDELMDYLYDRFNRIMIKEGERRAEERGKNEGIQIGKEEGIQIGEKNGIRKGEKKGISETVRKFKAAGAPMSMIMAATGMTEAQIKAL